MLYLLISIIFIILQIILIGVFIGLAYKNNSFISKSTSGYIIPVALLAIGIISLGYVYQNKTYSLEGFGTCIEYTAGLFIYSVKTEHIKELIDDSIPYAISYYVIFIMAIFTSTTSILGIVKNTIINFKRVSLRKFTGTDIIVGYGPKALEYAKNTKNSILWIYKPIKQNKEFLLKELYYNKIPYVLDSLTPRAIKSFIWNKKKEYNFIFFKESESLQYSELATIFRSIKFKKNRKIKVYFEGDKNEVSYINEQIASAENDFQCLMFCFDVYEKMARRFNWESSLVEYLPKGFLLSDGTVANDKTINVVILGYGNVNSAIFRSLVINQQFATYKEDYYESKKINYYIYDINEENFNDFTINRLEEEYFCKDNRKSFAKMEKLCNLQYSKGNAISKQTQEEIKNLVNKENAFTFFFVGFAEDLINISYSERLMHNYGKEKIHVFCNVDYVCNASRVDTTLINIYGLKQQIFSHEWIIHDQILELAIKRDKGYQLKSSNFINLKNWKELSGIKKLSNIYSALSLKFKLNLMGLDIATDKDKKISEEEFNKVYYASDKPISNGYEQYFDHNIRCTIGFTEHLRWCAFYYLNGYDVMDHKLCHLKGKDIITKNEKEKFHADLLSYYGLDDLNEYFLKEYQHIRNKIDVEVYQYDFALCDFLMKDILKLKEASFDLSIKRIE